MWGARKEKGDQMRVKVYHNGDDVFIAWKPAGFIPNCRGFALMRRRNGIEETVSTWVGLKVNHTKKASAAPPPTGRSKSISGPTT